MSILNTFNAGSNFDFQRRDSDMGAAGNKVESIIFEDNIYCTNFVVSNDGSTVVVRLADTVTNNLTRLIIRIYTKVNNKWTKQTDLLDTTTTSQLTTILGCISSNGNTLVITNPYEGNSWQVTDAGAVYVYTRNGVTWGLEKKISWGPQSVSGSLPAPNNSLQDYINSFFGINSSISSDGNTLLVKSEEAGQYGTEYHVFQRTGTTWVWSARLFSGGVAVNGLRWGSGVISEDGSTVLIVDNDGVNSGTYAFVYKRVNDTWTQVQTFGRDGTNGVFSGRFSRYPWIAISNSGSLISIYNPYDQLLTYKKSSTSNTWSISADHCINFTNVNYTFSGFSRFLSNDSLFIKVRGDSFSGYSDGIGLWNLIYTDASSSWDYYEPLNVLNQNYKDCLTEPWAVSFNDKIYSTTTSSADKISRINITTINPMRREGS
jgi:hypothetical protein